MINPKQGLTSFTRLYQASYAAPSAVPKAMSFGALAASLADAHTVHETDAAALAQAAQNYSITTVEEVAGLARLERASGVPYLAQMGLSPEVGARMLGALEQHEGGRAALTEMARFERFQYSLGCALDLENPPEEVNPFQTVAVGGVTFGSSAGAAAGAPAPGAATMAAPPVGSVNLIDALMSPIRDQGNRGTCVAFTTVACLEYHLRRFGGLAALDLSEQFQFWNLARTGQLNLISGFPLLRGHGVCRETTWPYYSNPLPPTQADPLDSQDPPPATAAQEAAGYRCAEVRQVSPRDVSAVQAELLRGRVVGIGIPVYDSWFRNGTVRQYGNITLPLPGEVPQAIGHAIALVGYADDPNFAGGGYFIVRNSWNGYWGTQSPFGAGYGTLPYLYLRRYNWDAWCISA